MQIDNLKFIEQLEDPYRDGFVNCPKEMVETHKTITTLKNLRDVVYDEAALKFWNDMSDGEQIKFLVDFVSNHYFYLFNRADESFKIHRIDTIKSKVANFETKKVIGLLTRYDQNDFLFELLDLIYERFLFDDEVFKKMENILADSELLYYDMPRNRFEDLKKDGLQSKKDIISKATNMNEIIEELQFYIYCTYFRFVKKVNFEDLEKYLPEKLKIYSPLGHGELNKKLNKLWKIINEDNNI